MKKVCKHLLQCLTGYKSEEKVIKIGSNVWNKIIL